MRLRARARASPAHRAPDRKAGLASRMRHGGAPGRPSQVPHDAPASARSWARQPVLAASTAMPHAQMANGKQCSALLVQSFAPLGTFACAHLGMHWA